MANGISDERFKLFAGPGADKFADKICWPGTFFPIVWFFYRKMYVTAAVIVVLPLALAFMFSSSTLSSGLGGGVAAVGAFGHRLYRHYADQLIGRIEAAAPSEDVARSEIMRAGGVSYASGVIGAVLTLALTILALATRAS